MDMNLFSVAITNHLLMIAAFDKKTHKCTCIKKEGKMLSSPEEYSEGSLFFYELSKQIHPNDIPILTKYVGDDQIYAVKNSITIIHMKSGADYIPYYFEFMNEGEIIYFTIRYADGKTAKLSEALWGFEKTLIKIVRWDLALDTFKEIKVFEDEKPTMTDFGEWVAMFSETSVFESDRKALQEFLSPEYVFNKLQTKKHLTFSYRRWYKNNWIIAMLHLIPCLNFGNGSRNEVMLYISQIS